MQTEMAIVGGTVRVTKKREPLWKGQILYWDTAGDPAYGAKKTGAVTATKTLHPMGVCLKPARKHNAYCFMMLCFRQVGIARNGDVLPLIYPDPRKVTPV